MCLLCEQEEKEGVWVVERTVLTPGGNEMGGVAIALLHVATWVTAFVIAILSYIDLNKSADVSSKAKNVALAYSLLVVGIVLIVVYHAARALPSDKFYAPIISMILLFALFIENVLGTALLSYALTTTTTNYQYSMVVVANVFVTLGSAMVVAFYVLWSHHGNLVRGAKDTKLSDYA